jgi:hypothetical protein
LISILHAPPVAGSHPPAPLSGVLIQPLLYLAVSIWNDLR